MHFNFIVGVEWRGIVSVKKKKIILFFFVVYKIGLPTHNLLLLNYFPNHTFAAWQRTKMKMWFYSKGEATTQKLVVWMILMIAMKGTFTITMMCMSS